MSENRGLFGHRLHSNGTLLIFFVMISSGLKDRDQSIAAHFMAFAA